MELNQIYNTDALEGLKQLDENSIDAIISDPPYQLSSITKRFGKEDSAEAQMDNVNVKIEEIDADSNTITLVADTELGSFWITAEMSVDQLISLIEVATKKLNKAKTLLETIK